MASVFASDPKWEFIKEVRVRLVEAGVPEDFFTGKWSLDVILTKKRLAKLLGPFRQADDCVKCESLLNIGIKHHYFDTVAGCTKSQFLAFLKFLRTPTGQDAITQQAWYDKLQRKGAGVFSVEEVALLSLEKARQFDLVKPTAEFKRLSSPKSVESFKVVEVSGESVRKRMRIDFLNEGDSKEQLMNYANNMLGKYEQQYDMKAAKRLRFLLNVVGGEQAVKVPGLVHDPATRAGVGAQASNAAPQVAGGDRKVPSTASVSDAKN